MASADSQAASSVPGSPTQRDAAEVRTSERDTRSSHTSVRRILFQMFNVLVGTAVFALPSAVFESGWLVFVAAQLLLAAVSAATSFYLLQTMQLNAMRPQTTAKDYHHHDHGGGGRDAEEGSHSREQRQRDRGAGSRDAHEHTPLLQHSAGRASGSGLASDESQSESGSSSSAQPLPKSSALLGLPHLCSHYGGRWLFYLYEVAVVSYLLFTLWGVCATFAGEASATVMALFYGQDCSMYNPETHGVASCQYAYYGSLALLSVLSVLWAVSGSPLSDLVSDGAALFKVFGFVLLIASVLMALLLGDGADKSHATETHDRLAPIVPIGALGMGPSEGRLIRGVCMALVYGLLSYNVSFDMAAVFSPEQWQWWTGGGKESHNQPHSNSPGSKPAMRAALLVTVTIVVTLSFYLVIGILCAALFGARASTLINLHWRQYVGLDFLDTSSSTESTMVSFSTPIPLWARLLQIAILAAPVVAAITSLPYLADMQSESLTRLIAYDARHPHETFILYRSSPPHIPGGKRSIALLSVLPPLLLTAVVGDLGEIFLWTAPSALFMQYVLPAVLLLLTRYGPNAEPQYGHAGRAESEEMHGLHGHVWYLKPALVVVLLAVSSIIAVAVLTLLCLHSLW